MFASVTKMKYFRNISSIMCGVNAKPAKGLCNLLIFNNLQSIAVGKRPRLRRDCDSPKNNTYELPSGDCFTAVDSKDKGVLKFTRFLGRATGGYQSRNAGGGPHYELLTKRFREWKIGYDTYSYTDKKTGDVFVVRTTQRKDGANRYLITRGK